MSRGDFSGAYTERFEALNDEQRQAVLHDDGPCMVVAPAGSGKTGLLTVRYCRLLQKVDSSRILCLTFTDKAGEEMRRRISQLSGITEETLRQTVGTFHSIFWKVLRVGVDQGFVKRPPRLIDPKRRLILLKTIAAKRHVAFGELNYFIDMAKRQGLTYETSPEQGPLRDAFRDYEKDLRDKGTIDFSDMLSIPAEIMSSSEDFRSAIANRYSYIMVDEAQDINSVQHRLLQLVSKPQYNVFLVGDMRQSIYSFRGGDPNLFQNVDPQAGDPKVIYLRKNYRSLPNIVKCANTLIRKNRFEHAPDQESVGRPTDRESGIVAVRRFESESPQDEEAIFIAEQARKLREQGVHYHDMGILCRCNWQFRVLQDTMHAMEVPCVALGNGGFYVSREVQDLMSFFELAESGDETALFHLLTSNLPFTKYIGKAFWGELCQQHADGRRFDGLLHFNTAKDWLRDRARFVHEFLLGTSQACRTLSPYEAMRFVLDRTEYLRFLKDEYKDEIGYSREDKVAEILRMAASHETSRGMLDHVKKMVKEEKSATESADHRVRLLTLHQAKGKEWSVVFICGVVDQILPHANSIQSRGGLKEERNLFYVGVTRARQRLLICTYDKPATFIRDIKETPIKFHDSLVLHSGRAIQEVEEDFMETYNDAAYDPSTGFSPTGERFVLFTVFGMPEDSVTATEAILREVQEFGTPRITADLSERVAMVYDFDDTRLQGIMNRMAIAGFIHRETTRTEVRS